MEYCPDAEFWNEIAVMATDINNAEEISDNSLIVIEKEICRRVTAYIKQRNIMVE